MKSINKFLSNPFVGKKEQKTILDTMILLSKPGQALLYYMLSKDFLSKEQFILDTSDFLKFSGYKTKASCFKALHDLCKTNIIAKTKFPFLFWVNQNFRTGDIKRE